MAERINWQDINEKFPIAGKDNDSQVFRNNFTLIKENWKLTRDLLNALDENAATLTGSNDFKGNELINAVLRNFNLAVDTTRINGVTGDILGDIYVNPQDGAVQVIRAKRNLRINFQGWTEGEYYQEIRLLLLTDGGPRRCDFLNPDGAIYSNNPDTDADGNPLLYAIPNDAARAVVVDVFTIDSGKTVQVYVYTDYSGFLDDGTIIDPDAGGTQLEDIKGILPLPNFYEEEGNKDSITDVIVTPFWPDGDNTQPTNILLVEPADSGNFYVGQKLRITGATGDDPADSANAIPITNFQITNVAYAEGTVEADWGADETLDYVKYKLHLIDFTTGKVSAAVEYAEAGDGLRVNFANFSNTNFIQITFDRPDITKGVLVYRSVNEGDYRLFDILGPKQLGSLEANIRYQDYGPFSFVEHSRKPALTTVDGIADNVSTANSYVSTTGLDLPIILSNEITNYGFVDIIVQEVNVSDPTRPYIVLTQSYYFNSAADSVRMSADDTQKIQEEIDQRALDGVGYLRLNSRTYNISQLNIPNNFVLEGTSERTIIRKSSFSPEATLTILNYPENADNIKIRNLRIDGNQQNQYLRNDVNLYENYAIHFPVSDEIKLGSGDTPANNIRLENVKISNILGGAVYAPYAEKVQITGCVFEDQGMDDIYGFSPLILTAGKNIMINNNTFMDFTDAVDVTTSDTGSVSGNVIKNCGTGLAVFGSRFLTTSPNTIVGPNNEFIWGPDIYNSEFDSINVFLTRDAAYTSDVYKYQENGEDFDFTTARADSNVIYAKITPKLYPLTKNAEGVEQLQEEIIFDKEYDLLLSDRDHGNSVGDFITQLQINNRIARGKVTGITSKTKYVSSGVTANVIEVQDGIGIFVGMKVKSTTYATEQTVLSVLNNIVTLDADPGVTPVIGEVLTFYSGEEITSITVGSNIGDPSAIRVKMYKGVFDTDNLITNESNSIAEDAPTQVFYVPGTGASPLQLSVVDATIADPTQGAFRFDINNDVEDQFTEKVNRLLDDYNTTELKKTYPDAIGLAYQVIFDEYATGATDINLIASYQIYAENTKQLIINPGDKYNIAVGGLVRTQGVNLTVGSTGIDFIIGKIVQVNTELSTVQVVVEYEETLSGAVPGTLITPAPGAFFARKNSFVVAKGRVQ